ncbi:peptide chain release factor aRF-1 [Candidatus Bathyarchaeota archaeon]|nr:peptide chain release factor aRF-1 [Candidatus Bathyarchaeota archaeon]MBS7631464.1 peptide chain release factor aRF-1 [Candidatus Bathyarchaeota archaeon]
MSKFKFVKMLEELEKKEGRGTELISVYIPPGKQVSEVMNDLRNEWGTAGNIKSKTTRKNVQDALTKVMERLKLFRKIPETGLVIFAGTIASDQLGVGDMETYVLIPPEPISTYYYRCEHSFMLEPLYDIIRREEAYGIIVMDSKEATFAQLKGSRSEIIREITSGVPGKHRAGGQSSRRFERAREMYLNEYYTRVGVHVTEIYKNMPNLHGIIIGGPGSTKEDFIKGDYIHYELKDKILGTVDTAYTGFEGVKEVIDKSKDLLKNVRFLKEREMIQNFLYNVGHDTGLATYGEKEVIQALKSVNVKTLLISEGLDRSIVKIRCRECGYKETKIVDNIDLETLEKEIPSKNCKQCGNASYIVEEKEDLIDALSKMAEDAGAEVEMISTQTEEGEMLLKSFGGLAALLKYRQFK